MANLVINEKLLQQLRSVAEREQRTVEELAEEALTSYVQAATPALEVQAEEPELGSFAALAKSRLRQTCTVQNR